MAINTFFYHDLIRRYLIGFGELFSNYEIHRSNGSVVKVPIAYSARDTFLSKRMEMPDRKEISTSLPRMAFYMSAIMYDSERAVNRIARYPTTSFYAPAYYMLNVSLYIATNSIEDNHQIVSQILPFFRPTWNISMKVLDNVPVVDIPISIESVDIDDNFESTGTGEDKRLIITTITFNMRVMFFGPSKEENTIKYIDVSSRVIDQAHFEFEHTTVGMTPSGEPTTDASQSVPYASINETDNYGIVHMSGEDDE